MEWVLELFFNFLQFLQTQYKSSGACLLLSENSWLTLTFMRVWQKKINGVIEKAGNYLLLGGKTSISPPTLPLLVCLGNFWSLSIQIPHHHWEALTLHDTLVIHGHICMRVSTSEQQNYYTDLQPPSSPSCLFYQVTKTPWAQIPSLYY